MNSKYNTVFCSKVFKYLLIYNLNIQKFYSNNTLLVNGHHGTPVFFWRNSFVMSRYFVDTIVQFQPSMYVWSWLVCISLRLKKAPQKKTLMLNRKMWGLYFLTITLAVYC